MKDKRGMVIFYDIIEQLEPLTDSEFRQVISAILRYDRTGEEPEINGAARLAFNFIKPSIDRQNEEYRQKCEKNAASIRAYWERKNAAKSTDKPEQKTTVTPEYERIQTNTNDNEREQIQRTDTDTDNKEKKENIKKKENQDIDFLLRFLNQKAGTRFRRCEETDRLIRARLKEHSVEEIQAVVGLKAGEWLNTPMQKYLRPKTLFNATNFENYYGCLGDIKFESSVPVVSPQTKNDVTTKIGEGVYKL